jgi:hypothetical protein
LLSFVSATDAISESRLTGAKGSDTETEAGKGGGGRSFLQDSEVEHFYPDNVTPTSAFAKPASKHRLLLSSNYRILAPVPIKPPARNKTALESQAG